MSERSILRKAQARAVMPLIGPLLDAWEGLPNDVAQSEDFSEVAKCIMLIDAAMENAE